MKILKVNSFKLMYNISVWCNRLITFYRSVDGDPISYKLRPARCDVTDNIWGQPQKLDVALFDLDALS